MTLQPELWGKVKRINPRRRFYKVLGTLPLPYGLILKDYTDIFNMIAIEYREADELGIPMLRQRRTEFVHDLQSQATYGERRLVIDPGTLTRDQAEALRDCYLEEYARPHIYWGA